MPDPVPREPEERQYASQVVTAVDQRNLLAEVGEEVSPDHLQPRLRPFGAGRRREPLQTSPAPSPHNTLNTINVLTINSLGVAGPDTVIRGIELLEDLLDVLVEAVLLTELQNPRVEVQDVKELLRVVEDVLGVQASDNTTFVVEAAQREAVPVDLEPSAHLRSHVFELEFKSPRVAVGPVTNERPENRRKIPVGAGVGSMPKFEESVPLVPDVVGGESISGDLYHDDELRKIRMKRIDDDGPAVAAANAIATRVNHLPIGPRIIADDDELVLLSAMIRATRSSGPRESVEALVPP